MVRNSGGTILILRKGWIIKNVFPSDFDNAEFFEEVKDIWQ